MWRSSTVMLAFAATASQQGALDLAAGGVLRMEHAAAGMAALAGEVEFVRAVAVGGLALVEVDAQRSINSRMRAGPSPTMVRTAASSHNPAPAWSVSWTCNSKAVLVAPDAGHAALRPGGVGIGGGAFGDDGHPPVRGGLERERQPGHAAADDDEVVALHVGKRDQAARRRTGPGWTTRIIDQARAPEKHRQREERRFVHRTRTGCKSSASTISA